MLNALLLILRIECALCVMFGFWSHNWLLIIAGAFCFFVTPFVAHEIREERWESGA